jgi:DNA helicase HerA-like ATPase
MVDATIALEARGTALLGAFVIMQTDSDEMLGRITETQLSNPVHNDNAFAPVIMKNGCVPSWSGEVDIEKAKIEIIAVAEIGTGNRIPIRRNVPSGTAVMAADQAAIERFSNERKYFLVLGHIPNSGGLLCSISNRDNREMTDINGNDRGGYGEAHHTAVLGQSGSAKTVLVTTMIAGRLAAHPMMGLLMPDTSGDLADPSRHNRGEFQWNYAEVLKRVNVEIERLSISDIRLTSTETLKFKLAPLFRQKFAMASPQADALAGYVVEDLFGENDVIVSELTGLAVLDSVVNNIARCYGPRATQQEKTDKALEVRNHYLESFNRALEPIRRLFDGRIELRQLIHDILNDGRKVIIEMSRILDTDHRFIMREIIDRLQREARRIFYRGGTCNTLVVLDEAIRWVPERAKEEDDKEGLANLIETGFRETRKYGIGWMVVAQSPSQLSKRVLRECHTKMFGRNLGIGADRTHLEQMLSKQGAQAYDQLQIQGGYFWVGMSLNNNLGSGSSYFSLHPFGGNATQAFMDANPHIFGRLRTHKVRSALDEALAGKR